jgi:hypothetical protein
MKEAIIGELKFKAGWGKNTGHCLKNNYKHRRAGPGRGTC